MNDNEPCELIVSDGGKGIRLDKFISESDSGLTRSRVHKLIVDGRVSVNDATVIKNSAKVHSGDKIIVKIPPVEETDLVAENIPLDIIFEDEHLLVINKPAGMVTHPAPGHVSGTLVNAVMGHCKESLSGIGGAARPGIVHRLDKLTSGLILVAKNDEAHASLSAQLKSRDLSRRYIAVVKGEPKLPEGEVKLNIGRHPKDRKRMAALPEGGREAISHYKVVMPLHKASVVEVSLMTGRTHQIRVHMLSLNCPVIGDPVYSRGIGKWPIDRQALHAVRIGFTHPATGEKLKFSAPLPGDMVDLIQSLGGDIEHLNYDRI